MCSPFTYRQISTHAWLSVHAWLRLGFFSIFASRSRYCNDCQAGPYNTYSILEQIFMMERSLRVKRGITQCHCGTLCTNKTCSSMWLGTSMRVGNMCTLPCPPRLRLWGWNMSNLNWLAERHVNGRLSPSQCMGDHTSTSNMVYCANVKTM